MPDIDVNIRLSGNSCEKNKMRIKECFYFDEQEPVFKEEKNALHIAIDRGNYELVKLLLSKQEIDINLKSSTTKEVFFMTNMANNTYSILEEEKTSLYMSIENGHTKIAELLLQKPEININEKSFISIKAPFEMINKEFEYLNAMKPIKFIMTDEKTALHIAIEKNDINTIKHLLSRPEIMYNIKSINSQQFIGKDIKLYVKEEQTELHAAVKQGNIELINSLLYQTNIDINLKNNKLIRCINYQIIKEDGLPVLIGFI